MSSQRYERVAAHDEDDASSPVRSPTTHRDQQHQHSIPSSPPPSFHSRASSPTGRRLLADHDPITSDADRTLADTFDSPLDDESDDDGSNAQDDRQRLIRTSSGDHRLSGEGHASHESARPAIPHRVTQLPVFAPTTNSRTRSAMAHDGVFANISAKPTRGEQEDEKPPTYEQAAADATPPYWETTILAPGMVSDEVFVDGLPVGSVFSFAWNAMISMSFQLVGFLLTYLLHTTHAAKNGSRAGLGITLIQFGFAMKGSSSSSNPSTGPQDPAAAAQPTPDPGDPFSGAPADPNAYAFDPSKASPDSNDPASAAAAASSAGGLSSSDWIAYILMILGWFILIKSVNDFLKARRHEQLVLQSPDRGLPVPVVAEGEQPESAV